MKNQFTLIRQGDVLFLPISSLPNGDRKKRPTGTVAYGEVTGHHHSLATEDLERAEVLEIGDGLFVHVSESGIRIDGREVFQRGAAFEHQEHLPVTLPAGDYKVIIQREYQVEAIRNVVD